VQPRLQGALLAGGWAELVTGPTTTHAFWQFIAAVSQLTWQAVVDVCDEISGVGGSGVG
jgi:hypothetical protein